MNISVISKYRALPRPVKSFITRAVLLIAIWKLLYEGFLRSSGIPDDLLTSATGEATAWLVSQWYQPATASFDKVMSHIHIDGKLILYITDVCNGLELFVTYIGFLLCYPTSVKRTLKFVLGGVAVIFSANIMRCTALVWLHEEHIEWISFAHHYLFQLLMYAFIFGMWIWYSKLSHEKRTD